MGTPNDGSSAVIGPDGRILCDKGENETLIYADLDLEEVVKNKTFADARGHCRSSRKTCLDQY